MGPQGEKENQIAAIVPNIAIPRSFKPRGMMGKKEGNVFLEPRFRPTSECACNCGSGLIPRRILLFPQYRNHEGTCAVPETLAGAVRYLIKITSFCASL